jgi:DNA-binding MarR family transcriptional regulator
LAQLDALAYLAACNRYSDTPAAVAEYLDVTRGTASQSLRALERKALVHRRGDEGDRRVRHLAPTSAGRDVVAEIAAGEIGTAVEALGPPVADALGDTLERVLRTVQARRGRVAFGVCATCRHLRGVPGERRCGLTGEPLAEAETALVCIEHAASRVA